MIQYPSCVKAAIPDEFDCFSSTCLLDWLVKAEKGLPHRFFICTKKGTVSSSGGWDIHYTPDIVIVDTLPIPQNPPAPEKERSCRKQKQSARAAARQHRNAFGEDAVFSSGSSSSDNIDLSDTDDAANNSTWPNMSFL